MNEKTKRSLRRALHVLMALCAAGILCSALLLFFDQREYAAGDAAYRQVRLVRRAPPSAAAGAAPAAKAETEDSAPDFTALQALNPDVVAWLTAGGTEIDYPVVRGRDNGYYLRHLFTGEKNKLGSLFMDYRNQADFSGRNTVIYGHNMKDGSMFSSLTNYKSQSYYNSHPAMELDTPEGSYTLALFAGLIVDGNYESVRFDFQDDQDFQHYLDSLRKESTFSSQTQVGPHDRIVTLCTCSYEFTNARYALFGKLVSTAPHA